MGIRTSAWPRRPKATRSVSTKNDLVGASVYQFTEHLAVNERHSLLQSAHKPLLLVSMNQQHVTLLVLLDLSAAFDAIHHDKLIQRLKSDCGVTGNALASFSFFIYVFFLWLFYWTGFYSCPEGKGTRGLQGPILRCPTSATPPFAYEGQPQHRDHPTLFEKCVGSFTSHRIINIQGIVSVCGLSKKSPLCRGIPQGSCLDPLLFTI